MNLHIKKMGLPLCLLLTLLAACTFTTKKIKNPEWGVPEDSLASQLRALVSCQTFNVNGLEITTNGKVTTEVEIDVINGANIPTNGDQLIALGKTIASVLKHGLKNENEYESYKVLFVTQVENGNSTSRQWKGKVYKSEEL